MQRSMETALAPSGEAQEPATDHQIKLDALGQPSNDDDDNEEEKLMSLVN